MRRRTGILLVAAVILSAFVTVTILRRPPDPLYQGKRLSAWLDIYGQDIYNRGNRTTINVEAPHAIRQIGTNAIPLLLHWLAYDPPMTRYPVCQRLPQWILRIGPVWGVLNNPKGATRAEAAHDAFGLLGELATPALPELMRQVSVKKPSAGRDNALLALTEALTHMEHPPIPALAVALSEPDIGVLLGLQKRVKELGTNARPLVPVLVQNLRSTNRIFASMNATLLGDLRLEPEVVVPALATCLQDPQRNIRGGAVRALSQFGEAASTAQPALTHALSDPDPYVRTNAGLAIQAISPTVRTVAPAQ